MTPADWGDPELRSLGMLFDGCALNEEDERARPLQDDDFLLLLHAGSEPRTWVLPESQKKGWLLEIDTHKPTASPTPLTVHALTLPPKTMRVARRPRV